MLDQILSFLTSGLNACFTWFSSLLDAIPGSWGLILSMITVGLVARFLLAPLFGFSLSFGSDSAARDKSWSAGSRAKPTKRNADVVVEANRRS